MAAKTTVEHWFENHLLVLFIDPATGYHLEPAKYEPSEDCSEVECLQDAFVQRF